MKTLRKLSKSKLFNNNDNESSRNNITAISRRKSSSHIIAMHRGTLNILVVGSNNVGKETMCQLYGKKVLNASSVNESDNSKGEKKFQASIILPSLSNNAQCFHYDIKICVVSVEWRQRNPRLYKDRVLSSDAFVLVYNETKRQSFVSLIELASEVKHFRQKNSPVNIACVKAQKGEMADTRQEDLCIMNEDTFDINLNSVDSINEMFHSLVCKCVDFMEEKWV